MEIRKWRLIPVHQYIVAEIKLKPETEDEQSSQKSGGNDNIETNMKLV